MDSVPDPDFFLSKSINLFYTSEKEQKQQKKIHIHYDFDSRLHSSLVQKGKFIKIIHKHHCFKLVSCTMSHRQKEFSFICSTIGSQLSHQTIPMCASLNACKDKGFVGEVWYILYRSSTMYYFCYIFS